MRPTVAIGCLFAVTAMLAHLAHQYLDILDSGRSTDPHETLPSAEALQLMALTYDEVVADYYWLRTVSEFGDVQKHVVRYPNVVPMTERVLTLDPRFKTAYTFAGTALTVEGFDTHEAIAILRRGVEHRPDVWQIPFYLGFNLYYFLGDFEGAAEAMARAAMVPGAPEIAGHLATRLAAQAQRPEVGIQMIDSILDSIDDERTRNLYLERRRILMVELHLLWLNEAITHFRGQRGKCPASIDDLVTAGVMRAIPDEPLGGEYRIKDCRAVTTSKYEELRVRGKTGVNKK